MSHFRLEPKSILQNRWRVENKLAEGGFGAVYEVIDEKSKKSYALKIETANQANVNPVLKVEAAVLMRLRGKSSHVCGIVGCGAELGKFNFIVMDLVGQSLADVHKSRPRRRFTEATTARVGLQCLQGIEDLHSIGFVHRDIKPGNFAVGKNPTDRQTIYLLDFGLARLFRIGVDKGDSGNRAPRDECGFRGTVRYASTNAHDGLEVGRHDDIWSMIYVLVEFQHGKLPWHELEAEIDVARMKRRVGFQELVGDMGVEYVAVLNSLKQARYSTALNYDWLRNQLKDLQEREEYETKGPFEWDKDGK